MRGFFFHPHGRGGCSERMHSHREGGRGEGRFGPRGFFGGRGEGRGNPFERERGGRDGRGFGHGGLRLVILKLLEDGPSHGYELIKAIEERSKGRYAPSPGVIYPTLSWLEDEGFITVTAGDDGRKQATITDAGKAFLAEKAEAVDALFSAMDGEEGEHGDYAPLFRAMSNLKTSLRMRGMKPMQKAEIEAIVDLIDDVAKKIERL